MRQNWGISKGDGFFFITSTPESTALPNSCHLNEFHPPSRCRYAIDLTKQPLWFVDTASALCRFSGIERAGCDEPRSFGFEEAIAIFRLAMLFASCGLLGAWAVAVCPCCSSNLSSGSMDRSPLGVLGVSMAFS